MTSGASVHQQIDRALSIRIRSRPIFWKIPRPIQICMIEGTTVLNGAQDLNRLVGLVFPKTDNLAGFTEKKAHYLV